MKSFSRMVLSSADAAHIWQHFMYLHILLKMRFSQHHSPPHVLIITLELSCVNDRDYHDAMSQAISPA